jgi:hypothetical protein
MRKNTSVSLAEHFKAFLAEQIKAGGFPPRVKPFAPACGCSKSMK